MPSKLRSGYSMQLTFLFAKNVYIVGTTNSVKIVPMLIPEKITKPISHRLCEPAPLAKSNGNTPNTIANVVIKIGRRRRLAD